MDTYFTIFCQVGQHYNDAGIRLKNHTPKINDGAFKRTFMKKKKTVWFTS